MDNALSVDLLLIREISVIRGFAFAFLCVLPVQALSFAGVSPPAGAGGDGAFLSTGLRPWL